MTGNERQEYKSMLEAYIQRNLYASPDKDKLKKLVPEAYEDFLNLLDGIDTSIYGELLEATKNRDRHHLEEGEFISNAAGVVFGHREVYGEETNRRTGVHLEIKVALDVSGSMADCDGLERVYVEGGINGRYWSEKMTEEAEKNPIIAMPRVFSASLVARTILKSLEKHIGNLQVASMVNGFCFSDYVTDYKGEVYLEPPIGGGTPILPLFKEIQRVEGEKGYYTSNRLDLIVTDGGVYLGSDLEPVNEVQDERVGSGTVTTIFLNILPKSVYDASFANNPNYVLPNYTVQYNVGNPILLAHTMSFAISHYLQRV